MIYQDQRGLIVSDQLELSALLVSLIDQHQALGSHLSGASGFLVRRRAHQHEHRQRRQHTADQALSAAIRPFQMLNAPP